MKLSDCVPGVRVALYNNGKRIGGVIYSYGTSGELVFVATEEHGLCMFHPKQLRRLKPKEKKQEPPKAVWINYYDKIPYPFKDKLDADSVAGLAGIERLNNRAYRYILAEEQG